MSQVRDPVIIALLAEARLQFAAGIPAKVADLQALLDREAWDELRRAAHKLRGSSGTYGFTDISQAAAAVEEALIAAGGPPPPDVKARVTELVRATAQHAERVTP